MEIGKKINIYVDLIDGIKCLAPAIGKVINNDIVKILKIPSFDERDFSAIWKFFPGETVSIKKKRGVFVANKLLKSDKKNRKIFELIYAIFEQKGFLDEKQLNVYSKELNFLFDDSSTFIHKKHPYINCWIKKNRP